MFFTLLLVTFALAFATSFAVHRLFDRSIDGILRRVISDELGPSWKRYIVFAIYVVGVSGGVRIYELERYITQPGREPGTEGTPLALTAERWTLEAYRTIIETLQSIAWMLLVFFGFALVAFVIVRVFELWSMRKRGASNGDE